MAKKVLAKTSGPQAFDDWYSAMYPQRWPKLKTACLNQSRYFKLETGLSKPYFLDPASVLAALSLPIQPGQHVLDLCAAPGGKSLVLALRLFGLVAPEAGLSDLGMLVDTDMYIEELEDSTNGILEQTIPDAIENHQNLHTILCVNERSATRRGRLRRVVQQHLPASIQSSIRITGHDAALWGQHEQNTWDRILLDIPCSSERHLLHNPSYLQDWSPKRSTQLSQQAYAMGLSAALALKVNGLMLYCTCALSRHENDGVIERLLERSLKQSERYGFYMEIDSNYSVLPPPSDSIGAPEATQFGFQVWPDTHFGYGPLYFCRLKKTEKGTKA